MEVYKRPKYINFKLVKDSIFVVVNNPVISTTF